MLAVLHPDPVEQAPEWEVQRAQKLVSLFWAKCIVATSIVALRFYSRRLMRATGADDWIMLFTMANREKNDTNVHSQVLFCVLTCMITYYVAIGGCLHMKYLTLQQGVEAVQFNWITQPVAIIQFGTGKASVGMLILRLLPRTALKKRWFIYFCIVSGLIVNSLCCVFTFVQCNPVEGLWDPKVPANCWKPDSQAAFAMFSGGEHRNINFTSLQNITANLDNSAWNVALDVIFALFPIAIVYKVKISLRQKLGLCAILGLGLLAAVFASIKIVHLKGLTERSDLNFETYNLWVWTGAEIFIIIVTASAPPLKPLVIRWADCFRRRMGWDTKTRGASSSQESQQREMALREGWREPGMGHLAHLEAGQRANGSVIDGQNEGEIRKTVEFDVMVGPR
ncbi:hypothetical protein BDY21DRAFT_320566 [Lineolata rhizophorae]|uniref:Rhodopsin domain-containing protein n=1 Tax=Lineolata rhizophorae TaxID=578093 RepID=A0A6A6P240_9PEZI|nr:hypothetical protein BDY21DRAFT_320566 [Lineolata rhizophorae]